MPIRRAAKAGSPRRVEDLLIWSRHFDNPVLGKTLPTQLAAAAPLTGGHANAYRRGVAIGEVRGMETVGHGGLWPGFRTEFLRVPAADLTVIVIANLATIDPWRLAHVIAADALEGDKRLKPKLEPITEAEIKPIAGTWFNAEEPSLFDLAWKNGEAVVTQNGMPFVLGRRPGDWFGSERGSFEFMLKPGPKGSTLRVDLGAGRVLSFKKLGKRKAVPAALAGRYVSAEFGRALGHRAQGRELAGSHQRAIDRRRAGLAGARRRCRHHRDRDAGPARSRRPSSPTWCATARARSRPSRSQRAASRRCGSSGRLSLIRTAARLRQLDD